MSVKENREVDEQLFLLNYEIVENSEEIIIPVVQEQLHIDKETIDTATIHISKKVTAHQQEVNVPLISEQYDIVHVLIDKMVAELPSPVRHEGDTMIVSVIKEILVVEKKYQLVEEIHITKRVTEENAVQSITLRTEEVSIERTPNAASYQ